MKRSLPAALLLAFSPSLALADQTASSPAAASTNGNSPKYKMLLIPLTVAASTDGKAAFKAGFGAVYGIGDSNDLGVSVRTSAAAEDGLANLFTYNASSNRAESPAAWDVGLNVAYSRLSSKSDIGGDAGLPDDVRKEAFGKCACDDSSTDAFCKSQSSFLLDDLHAWIKKSAAEQVGDTWYCAEQQAAVRTANGLASEELRIKGRRKALEACVEPCATSSDGFCSKEIIVKRRKLLYVHTDGNNVCDEGKAFLTDYHDRRGRSLFPEVIVNAGFKVGWQQQAYRYASPDNANVLLSKTDTVHPWSFGLTGMYLPQTSTVNPTFELQALVASKYDPSGKTVKWCSPAGDVPRKDPLPGAAVGPTDPGQTCQEAALGAPTQATVTTLTFRVGVADGSRANWRVAFGPDISITTDDKGTAFSGFALRAPIYGGIKPVSSEEYKGLLRLTPALQAIRNADSAMDFRVTLELAILGQRRIFADNFDDL